MLIISSLLRFNFDTICFFLKGLVVDSVSEAMKHKKLNYLNEPMNATAFKVKLPELLSCVTANQRVCPEGAL